MSSYPTYLYTMAPILPRKFQIDISTLNLKPIPEFENYSISDYGHVVNPQGRILRNQPHAHGYRVITIGAKGHKKRFKIHRLVSQAFIPNTENKPFVNHKDGNKANNHVSNLEWSTHHENMAHAVATDHNRYLKGNKPKPVSQFSLSGALINTFKSINEAELVTGISISGCLKGLYKSAGGYLWSIKK